MIEEQIAKVRAAGIDVNAAIEGDLSSLPEIISVTLSRVVTESCSNIVKYAAHEAPATIMVEVLGGTIEFSQREDTWIVRASIPVHR